MMVSPLLSAMLRDDSLLAMAAPVVRGTQMSDVDGAKGLLAAAKVINLTRVK